MLSWALGPSHELFCEADCCWACRFLPLTHMPLRLHHAPTNATPASAVRIVRTLLDGQMVDVILIREKQAYASFEGPPMLEFQIREFEMLVQCFLLVARTKAQILLVKHNACASLCCIACKHFPREDQMKLLSAWLTGVYGLLVHNSNASGCALAGIGHPNCFRICLLSSCCPCNLASVKANSSETEPNDQPGLPGSALRLL